MVLRFTISTADEAASFLEACDTLFLDIWESTDSWVDVRLSEDVVSLRPFNLPTLQRTDSQSFRCLPYSASFQVLCNMHTFL